MSVFKNILSTLGTLLKRDSSRVTSIKDALAIGREVRGDNKLSEVIYDYPLLVELCKAYIDEKDYDSAQEIVRTCFRLREEYTEYGGQREAFLIRLIAKDLIANGREDIAQKVLRKVRNFEGGVPLHQLSTEFVPDRELLAKAMKEWDLKQNNEEQ